MKVAILMATYNGEKYLTEMIESILGQSNQNFECFIHDDGSVDKTREICYNYSVKYPNKIHVLDYASTGGASNNFISLLERVPQFDYYMFCDQDDVWMCNKIEKCLSCVLGQEDSIPSMVISDQKIVDQDLNIMEESYFGNFVKDINNISLKQVFFEGLIPGCTMLINQSLRKKVLEYRNQSNIFMHDWWSFEVVLAVKGIIFVVDDTLMLYRQHDNNCIGVRRNSLANRLFDNIRDFFKGSLNEKKRNRITRALNQSKELLYVTGLNQEVRQLLDQILETEKKNKVSRVIFYMKTFKNVKNIRGLLLWL